jgi:hypothetical protein
LSSALSLALELADEVRWTDVESVRMMWWGYAMRLSRIASVSFVLLVSAGGVDCEPKDKFSPPATPPPPPPPPEPAGESPAPPQASGDGEYAYTSGEVAVGAEADGYDDDDPAALSDFRPALEPYGTWVDDSTYGTMWVPAPATVGPDFRPYVTAGHWAYDDDWVWVSDYEWGWAPFHYGRWVWIDGRGWAWIPGRLYRGAWVTWGIDDGYTYVGWAPMPPAFVWFGGAAVVFPVYVGPRWVYCPRGDVFSPVVRTRIVTGAAVAPIATRVHPYLPATPTVAAAGPPPQRLGFHTAQIPHATGTTAASVARAQQFSSPSTAQPLGARAPTRVPLAAQGATHGTPVGQTPFRAPHSVTVAPSGPAAPHVSAAPAPGHVTSQSGQGGFHPPPSTGQAPPAHVAPAPHVQSAPRVHTR